MTGFRYNRFRYGIILLMVAAAVWGMLSTQHGGTWRFAPLVPLVPSVQSGPWRLWYADETYEDCDVPAMRADPAYRGIDCMDYWFPTSWSFATKIECERAAQAYGRMAWEDFCCAVKRPRPGTGDPGPEFDSDTEMVGLCPSGS